MSTDDGAYGANFARHYDVLTGHKDYDAEVAALDAKIRAAQAKRVLDIGCGSGRHARLLQERGYDVTAIDTSPDMIAIAAAAPGKVRFLARPLAELDEGPFDFAVSLFNVVNCLETFGQLEDFFRQAHRRLRRGGGFLFECWNAVAVIAAPPTIVERTYIHDGQKLVRTATPSPDFFHQRLRLTYDVEISPGDGGALKDGGRRFTSVHDLMLFTPAEIQDLLMKAGFGGVEFFTALPDLAPAGPHDRMLAVSCQKL